MGEDTFENVRLKEGTDHMATMEGLVRTTGNGMPASFEKGHGRTGSGGRPSVAALENRLARAEQARQLTAKIHAAEDVAAILVDMSTELLALFAVERLTIYAVDYERRELFSQFLDPESLKALREIRLPIGSSSIAGYVAQNRTTLRIADVYDKAALAALGPTLRFDDTWDKKTGYRTRQMLVTPLLSPAKVLCGVAQLINPRDQREFDVVDEQQLAEIAQSLGVALWNHYRRGSAKARPERKTRLGDLVARNLLTQVQLDESTALAQKEGRPLEFVVMERHGVVKRDVGQALAAYYGCPFRDYESGIAIPRELLKGINVGYLKAQFWAPLALDEQTVQVLIDDPHALDKLQDVRRLFPGRKVECVVALRSDLFRAITEIGTSSSAGTMGDILGDLSTADEVAAGEAADSETVDESSHAIVRLANQIIHDAYKARASDIHFEPRSAKREATVRIRVDGVCREFLRVPAAYRHALTARLKVMSRLDIAERRRPQDGKLAVRIDNRDVELRVATVPTAGDNEDVVLRILSAGEPLPLDKLAMTERNLRELRAILEKPYGLFLSVGPTGSGKTTTLHAALGVLNQPDVKIWTAEDPVEITQDGVRQVQINSKIGLNFPTLLRSFLRADPDVIMVGEMRDRETAETAIEASLTGHLVLSTLHTNSAAETVTRLLEMGLDPFNFADSLLGVVGQRLVRTLCGNCKEAYAAPAATVEQLARAYGEEAFASLEVARGEITLWRAKGCPECDQSGYRGRIGLHELLVANDEVKRLTRTRSPVTEIHEAAKAEGMTTLLQDGVLKVPAGLTDPSQVWASVMR